MHVILLLYLIPSAAVIYFGANNTLMLECSGVGMPFTRHLYSSAELLTLRPPRANSHLDNDVFLTLKEYGILRHTRRGRRRVCSGGFEYYPIPVVTNRNRDRGGFSGQWDLYVSNLVSVRCSVTYVNKNVNREIFAVVNTRSICNKTSMFLDYVIEAQIDLCVVTETWLSAAHEDVRSDIRAAGYVIDDAPR